MYRHDFVYTGVIGNLTSPVFGIPEPFTLGNLSSPSRIPLVNTASPITWPGEFGIPRSQVGTAGGSGSDVTVPVVQV